MIAAALHRNALAPFRRRHVSWLALAGLWRDALGTLGVIDAITSRCGRVTQNDRQM
jgi:hypothetical protein